MPSMENVSEPVQSCKNCGSVERSKTGDYLCTNKIVLSLIRREYLDRYKKIIVWNMWDSTEKCPEWHEPRFEDKLRHTILKKR